MATSARTARLRAQKKSERDFGNAALEWRRVLAEVWGTFLLVLVAAGGDMASLASGGALPRPIAAAAPGIMVMAVIYFMGSVSGAHLNPAVSFAFALRRNFPWYRVPGYIAAQLAGAVLAALLLRSLLGTAHGLGTTEPHGIGALQALALETVLTAALVNTILGTASGARNVGTNAGIAVGGYIALAGLWASTFSGASMNPARSFGPALVSGNLEDLWIYIVGPLAGATIGVGLEWLFKGPPTKSGSEAAQGSER
jgi:aquaporin Z